MNPKFTAGIKLLQISLFAFYRNTERYKKFKTGFKFPLRVLSRKHSFGIKNPIYTKISIKTEK